MQEYEIISILSKKEYEKIFKLFSLKFKNHKRVNRLAIQCTDTSRNDLDTRIRITNGNTTLMQKVGKWSSAKRQEIEVNLDNDPYEILKVHKTLRNMVTGNDVQTAIIQTDSLIYKTKQFEIKLTRQWGKKEVYNAEIEILDHESDPFNIAKKYNIPLHLPEQTAKFWNKWSKEVNLRADNLTDKQLLKLIKEYL